MEKQYLTRRQAAEYLTSKGFPVSWKYFQKLATVGGGPIYQRFGNHALYTPENLDAWAAARLSEPRSSTSEVE